MAVSPLAPPVDRQRSPLGLVPLPRDDEADEPISPELVLVSPPDVARRAREALPVQPAFPPRRPAPEIPPGRTGPSAIRRSPDADAVVAPAAAVVAAPPRTSRSTRLVGVVATVALVLSIVALARTPSADTPTLEQATVPATPVSTLPRTPAPGPGPTTTPARAARTPARRHVAPPRRTATTPKTTTLPASPPSPNPRTTRVTPIVPARVFSWPRIQGSSTYLVEFYRGTKRIFRRSVVGHSVRVTLVFPAGTYRWVVRPTRADGSFAAPIVDSTFAVPASAR